MRRANFLPVHHFPVRLSKGYRSLDTSLYRDELHRVDKILNGVERFDKPPKIVSRNLILLLREQPGKKTNQNVANSLKDILNKPPV
jgi:hypothetical protein